MNTISVQRGPRPSNQACGLPSIWASSPNRGQRPRSWNTRLARRFFGRHTPKFNLDPAHRLGRDLGSVQLRQLLSRRRRAETGVFLLLPSDGATAGRAGVIQGPRPPSARQLLTRRLNWRTPIPSRSDASRCDTRPRSPGAPETRGPAPRRSSKSPRRPSVPRAQKGLKRGHSNFARRGDSYVGLTGIKSCLDNA